MSGFMAEELRLVEEYTDEELEERIDRAKTTEEEARHDRQLSEHELGRRLVKKYLEARTR